APAPVAFNACGDCVHCPSENPRPLARVQQSAVRKKENAKAASGHETGNSKTMRKPPLGVRRMETLAMSQQRAN
ncbi:MAG TPA: hypothetical protein VMT58_01315, partial [Candidatus Binataceae bacterium]|nr:hypothetical protein [Candidatus Binataceae bacterium]